MQKTLFCFSCTGSGSGHRLIGRGYDLVHAAVMMPGLNPNVMKMIDGSFTPYETREQGIYQVSVIPPVIIVAWHDYMGDMRPGSNTALIGQGFESADEIIKAARIHYPQIMDRQPELKPFKTK